MNQRLYRAWDKMKSRCREGGKLQTSRPTYKGCAYIQEWNSFEVFSLWAVTQKGFDRWDLDKDILVRDNKIYSPDTCLFVPSWVNTLLINGIQKGDLPVGVVARQGRYASSISKYGKGHWLGTFGSPEEAHTAYLKAKVEYLNELKEDLDEVDIRIHPALIKRFL